MRDQYSQPQACLFLAAQEHTVGALIRDHFKGGRSTFSGGLLLIQRIHHAHDFRRRRVLQRDDLNVRISHLIDALDDPRDTIHVVGTIRDDEDVRSRVRSQMPVLRNERPQDRHKLRRIHVFHCDHLGDDLIGCGAHMIWQVIRWVLTRIRVGDDLDDAAGWQRDVAVHLQDRQERLVKSVGRHRG